MKQARLTIAITVLAFAAPGAATSQDHGHADQSHSHAGAAVECTTLASPPWVGLPDHDRMKVAQLQEATSALATPEAARAAGYVPALGDIPGMGIHYVSGPRMADGVKVDDPDHLLFAEIGGEERLVGAAYAFRDVPDTDVPIPFDSDLAHWHDHPQFAPEGQTLHMLHVWFIPSSNGPFAGLNFWLPFESAGVHPPSSCWMADEEVAQVIRTVSFALAPREWGQGGAQVIEAARDRAELLEALDSAARATDQEAWMTAAHAFIENLTPEELELARQQLASLADAQMSTAQREGGGR